MGCIIKIGNQSVSETDFLNHLNKIISVNKLFEENPDFSSQIYEALGYKESNNIEILTSNYTRQSVQNDVDSLYLFTDNAQRTSRPSAKEENVDKNSWYYKKYKSQTNKPIHFGSTSNPTSAVIRGLNNAYPISTMSAYGTNWTDSNFELFKQTIDDEIAQIKKDLSKFSKVKIGDFRIGQGGRFAKLPQQHQQYLDNKLLEIGIDNTGNKPKIINSPITQDNKSYYRGQIEQPTIDKDGNLILYAKEDELYKKAGLKSKGVSMTDDLQSAIDYGNGQLEVAINLASETYDRDAELERLSTEGYWLIQIPKNISNEIVKEAGEVKVIGDKIIIPKGQYKIEQVVEGLEAQITPEQKQKAIQVYSQYLDTIFPDSKVKDIVTHFSKNEFEVFDKNKQITGTLGKAFYFYPYISSKEEIEYEKKHGNNVRFSLLNINKLGVATDTKATTLQPLLDNNDGVQLNNTEIVVFEPEQIHILGSKQDIEGFKDFVQGKQFQKLTAEEKAKTIEQVTKEHRSITALKDLAAKLAHRIGGKVEFENKTDVDWKGYNQGMTSVLNEAYMTPDTPFHEIAFHPIIRALKSISSQKESVTLQQTIDNQEIEKKCS